MNKINVLTVLVILLVILNIGIMAWLVYSPSQLNRKQHHPRHKEPKHMVIDRLGFNENQVAQYELLIKEHKSMVASVEDKRKKMKLELYLLLTENDSVKKDSLIRELASLQRDIEEIHFNHFVDIERLCLPKQKESFHELILELPKFFSHPPLPRHRSH